MPAKSKAQQRLMGAAEHGADFPMARKIRASMTKEQMHDFAAGSQRGKPEHVKHKKSDGDRLGSGSHGFRTHKK